MLILDAQINAFFFEHYKPLVDGLGTYISQMHGEHGIGDSKRPLWENETDIQEQQLPVTTTTSAIQSPHRNVWLNKLWPSKIASSSEQEREGGNITGAFLFSLLLLYTKLLFIHVYI